MKNFSVFIITIYQIFISPILRIIVGAGQSCRFSISCSEYTKKVILEQGFIKGSILGARRIASCI